MDWMGGGVEGPMLLPVCYTLVGEPIELDAAAMQWGPSMDEFGAPIGC